MKGPGVLAEFLPPYLAEVEELLVSSRSQLLAAETSTRAGRPNVRAVLELFRAIHTIKGLSAMVEVEPIVRISHVMESSLRAAEQSDGLLSKRWLELLDAGVATIGRQLKSVASGDPVPEPSPELLEALERLTPEAPKPASTPSGEAGLLLDEPLAGKLTASEREQLLQGLSSGRRVVRVDFAPSPQNASRGLNINVVRERVSKVAEIVRVLPLGVPVSERTPGGLVFAMLVLTREADAALAEAAGAPPEAVRPQSFSDAPSAAPSEANPRPSGELDGLPADDLSDYVARTGLVRVEASRLDDAMERVGAMVVNRSRLLRAVAALSASGVNTRELSQVLAENARLLRDMRAAVVRMRMVRVSELLERLPLMVRGLRRRTGKSVDFTLEVGETELDKSVGDRLFPAIVHLVRNAVDHAIEPPDVRRSLGKHEEGKLRVSCHERANTLLELVIEDDGRGVDANEVAKRAGRPVPANDEELLALLCRPGLSTRDEVTTTSGRGMGMDIVRRIVVEQLGGELQMETRPGHGTRFTARVPLTLSILDAFIFESGDQRYAVAISTVDELVDVDTARVVRGPTPGDGGRRMGTVGMIARRGESVPLLLLAELLHSRNEGAGTKAIVIQHQKRPLAFAIDRLVSQQEVVIRPLEDALVQVRGVVGATDLGDGVPTLVLDLPALGALAEELWNTERAS